MRNMLLFGTILLVMTISLGVGARRRTATPPAPQPAAAEREQVKEQPQATGTTAIAPTKTQTPAPPSAFASGVPHIGSVQVLNGCGAEGAATHVADFLRSKNFDVKDIGNAPSWNYPATMVISRSTDMSLANEIERFMKTGKVALMRNGEQSYDVTVIVGPDFEEKIR